MEYTNLTKEQIQTIIHYRKNKTKFYSLSNDEINALFEFLQESFLCIVFKQEKFLFKVDKRKDWKEYRKKVWEITKQQDCDSLPDSEKQRATNIKHFQSKEHYVLDHIVSIWYGYKHGLPENEIGHISNLRWISAKENSRKGIRCGTNSFL